MSKSPFSRGLMRGLCIKRPISWGQFSKVSVSWGRVKDLAHSRDLTTGKCHETQSHTRSVTYYCIPAFHYALSIWKINSTVKLFITISPGTRTQIPLSAAGGRLHCGHSGVSDVVWWADLSRHPSAGQQRQSARAGRNFPHPLDRWPWTYLAEDWIEFWLLLIFFILIIYRLQPEKSHIWCLIITVLTKLKYLL